MNRNYVRVNPDGSVRAFVSDDEYVISGDLLRVENIFPEEADETNMQLVLAVGTEYGILEESRVEIFPDTKVDFIVLPASASSLKKLQQDYVLGLIWRMGFSNEVKNQCKICRG